MYFFKLLIALVFKEALLKVISSLLSTLCIPRLYLPCHFGNGHSIEIAIGNLIISFIFRQLLTAKIILDEKLKIQISYITEQLELEILKLTNSFMTTFCFRNIFALPFCDGTSLNQSKLFQFEEIWISPKKPLMIT